MRYQRIHAQIWADEKFRRLAQDAKFLFIYLLTSPHSNAIGIYVLPKKYIECDLDWSMEQLAIPFAELLEKGLILYDDDARIVCIKNQIKHNPIENPLQVKSAEKIVASLPKSHLFSAILEQLTKPYHKPLRILLAKRYGKRYGKPEEEEEKEKETETETETFCGCQENEKDHIPYAEIQAAFNEILDDLPPFRAITEERREAIRARWNTDEKTCTLEWWRDAFFPHIASSDFLCGRNGNKWKCNINWILKPENFQKIREGTYNNRR